MGDTSGCDLDDSIADIEYGILGDWGGEGGEGGVGGLKSASSRGVYCKQQQKKFFWAIYNVLQRL